MIDFGTSCCYDLQNEFLPNKYKWKWEHHQINEYETKNLIVLGGSEDHYFLPLFDLYRYITYCFVIDRKRLLCKNVLLKFDETIIHGHDFLVGRINYNLRKYVNTK